MYEHERDVGNDILFKCKLYDTFRRLGIVSRTKTYAEILHDMIDMSLHSFEPDTLFVNPSVFQALLDSKT